MHGARIPRKMKYRTTPNGVTGRRIRVRRFPFFESLVDVGLAVPDHGEPVCFIHYIGDTVQQKLPREEHACTGLVVEVASDVRQAELRWVPGRFADCGEEVVPRTIGPLVAMKRTPPIGGNMEGIPEGTPLSPGLDGLFWVIELLRFHLQQSIRVLHRHLILFGMDDGQGRVPQDFDRVELSQKLQDMFGMRRIDEGAAGCELESWRLNTKGSIGMQSPGCRPLTV